MLKKLMIYILTVITLGINPVNNNIEYIIPEIGLLQIFQQSGCELEYFNSNGYLIYEKEFITIDMEEKICDDIAEKLNLFDIKKDREELNTYNSFILKGTNTFQDEIVIIIQSSKKADYEETILTIDCKNTLLDNYLETSSNIREVMKGFGKPNYNTVLVGYKDLDASTEMLKRSYIESLMDIIDCDIIETFEDNKIISITGYCKAIEEYLEYCNNKANVNIAVSCDNYNKKTYLYLASPIINIEY